MKIEEILSKVDHTLLTQTATESEIRTLCDEAIHYHTASVCIPPCYVKMASDYCGGRMRICTVIGFPNGYQTTAVKAAETKEAIENGADELDMVINLSWLRDGKYEDVEKEIRAVRKVSVGKCLKVIIETCLLTEEEKIRMCKIVSDSGADFIKTSTGFSTGGATRADIALFAKYKAPSLKIKAAGGIASLADAEELISLGAERLGTSRIIKIVKNKQQI